MELPKCSPNLAHYTPYLSPKYLKQYKKIWKHPLKILFFISQHFGNPKFPELLTLPDIENVELIVFVNPASPKQLVSPSVFKELFSGGILINVGNLKILKTSYNISKSYWIKNIFEKVPILFD